MTEELYFIEEVSQNSMDMESDAKKRKKTRKGFHGMGDEPSISEEKSNRLQEIEQQLVLAESKCNTLKGQVDYMKTLYNGMVGDQSTEQLKPSSKEHQSSKGKKSELETVKPNAKKQKSRNEEVPSRDVDPQSGSKVSTVINPNADAANRSLNNILTGIADSVNRLTQLHVHMGSTHDNSKPDPIGVQTIKYSPRDAAVQSGPGPEAKPDDFEVDVKKKMKRKPKVANKSIPSVQSKRTIKITTKHIEKKSKLLSDGNSATFQTRYKQKPFGKLKVLSSRTLMIKKMAKTEEKLVELYRNSAVQMVTASEDFIQVQPNQQHTTVTLDTRNNVQPLTMNQPEQNNCDINENQLVPVVQYQGSYYRNYELPTIASKMKQVAKSYFENFNFRTIPFVTATSTSPSHNLGVNIQQVLSIIKGRRPISGISPTLAYNIELAASKFGSRPLSALVTSLGSRMYRNTCPMASRYSNYGQLQELAKEIPEETVEELAECEDKNVGTETCNEKEKVWTVDPETLKDKCTCLPNKGVHFNDVCTKYASVPENKQPTLKNKPINRARKVWNVKSRYRNIPGQTTQINRRERTLKEVLKSLHDRFAQLNDRYDELKMQVMTDNGTDQKVIEELENLEKELQEKEEEITMVMSLYKEVLALKEQVKMLKKRASQSTVAVAPYNRNHDYKDVNAAGHLTKLLRHIQQFQGTLKKPAVEI